MLHNFTPKVPGKHDESKFIYQQIKQENQALKATMPSSSLIGQKSGKDRIDRLDMYKKHEIGKDKEVKQDFAAPVVTTTIGGTYADKSSLLQDGSLLGVSRPKKAFEKVKQEYLPISMGQDEENGIIKPKPMEIDGALSDV